MSIRPIDMMMMPNKSQETSIYQHQDQQRLEHDQHYQEHSFQNHVKQNGEKTIQPEKSENQEYRYRDRKGNGNGGAFQGNKNGKQNAKKEEEKKEEIKLSRFDVKI